MESRELKAGEELEVGDEIEISPALGNSYKVSVIRVTKIFAFALLNKRYEAKFHRIFDYTFQVLPKEKWRTTQYKVYRSVDDK